MSTGQRGWDSTSTRSDVKRDSRGSGMKPGKLIGWPLPGKKIYYGQLVGIIEKSVLSAPDTGRQASSSGT